MNYHTNENAPSLLKRRGAMLETRHQRLALSRSVPRIPTLMKLLIGSTADIVMSSVMERKKDGIRIKHGTTDITTILKLL